MKQVKKLYFVTNQKGGCGKSVCTFLFAQKHPEAIFLDCDDATGTSKRQLQYLNVAQISFLNSAKVIDRGLFNDFLEYISSHSNSLFVCDLGASLAEQLPFYLQDHGADVIRAGLDALNIEMNILCVIGGQNIFAASMQYLQSLAVICNSKISIRVAINDHFPLTGIQQEQFIAFEKAMKLKDSFHFDLSKDKNLTVQQKINDILKDGNGLKDASVFTKILFENAIKNFPL